MTRHPKDDKEIRIVAAPDSFKGVLTAPEAAAAIATGVNAFQRISGRRAVCVESAMADGGEGTACALASACGAEEVKVPTFTADMRPLSASYFIDRSTSTAFIDLASASGLPLVPPERRDPMRVSTFGTGLLILDAIGRGVRSIIVGAGGSATVDGGIGALQALGCRFYAAGGRIIDSPSGGAMLAEICGVDTSELDRRLSGISLTIAVDVDAPLTGPRGAAQVFGPQKGASPEQVKLLETGLNNLKRYFKHSDCNIKVFVEETEKNADFTEEKPEADFTEEKPEAGFGAAGGFAGGMAGIAGAVLAPGATLVADTTGLAGKLSGASLLIVGEGSADRQTLMNKAPLQAMRIAARIGVPTALLAGRVADRPALLAAGFSEVICINDPVAQPTPSVFDSPLLSSLASAAPSADGVDPLDPSVAFRRLASATLALLSAHL